MPTISMNYNDHQPPHFHARYQDGEVTVEIEAGIVRGVMLESALRMIFEWSDAHREDLLKNWDRARER